MLRVPVVSWKRRCVAAGEDHLGGKALPAFYMSEYSVLGFFVENVDEAVRVIRKGGFSLQDKSGAGEILLEAPGDVYKVAHLLRDSGIKAEIADVVDGLYQG